MEIRLDYIDRSNWEACCRLKLTPEQREFVAPNTYSLVQAAYEPDCYPMGIWADGELAGFLMWDFDEDTLSWEMCRLMVDVRFQGKGIGEAAVKRLLQLVTAKLGHIPFFTSADPANAPAIRLYEKLGFVKTGAVVEGETELRIQL